MKGEACLMARINIEDSIYRDIRWTDLVLKLGHIDTALGALVRSWALAQKWYLTPSRMIPIPEWEKQRINPAILETGWATVEGDFVRVAGADEQFAWLAQRAEAGRRGGNSPRGQRLSAEEVAKRQAARLTLNKAVKSGKVSKPDHCENCEETRSLHGHHADYSKPLEVDWLCHDCHVTIHKIIDENSKRPLDPASSRLTNVKPPPPSPPQSQNQEEEIQQPCQLRLDPDGSTASPAGELPLVKIWNANRGTLPAVKACGSTRRRQAQARWREKPDPDYWASVVKRISASGFCRGENRNGWLANFDFLVRPETQHKALEGQFDSPQARASAAAKPKRVDLDRYSKLPDCEECGDTGRVVSDAGVATWCKCGGRK